MHAKIAHPLAQTAAGATAEAVLRACVHCGMCNAVCPTYAIAGDERDGPRGRIYLMKQALEGAPVGAETRRHLDRCLSCRACEVACPSGVQYHRLLDVGREQVAARAPRPWPARLGREAIRALCDRPATLRLVLRATGQAGPAPRPPVASPRGDRRMILLRGCVQSAAAPRFNAATREVFGRLGIALDETAPGSCCGALDAHLDAPAAARVRARRNVASWNGALDDGAEAIVVNASGCAAFIRDYPDLLADELALRERATRVAAAVRDPVEILAPAVADGTLAPRRAPAKPRLAVHDPCTLRHAARLGGAVADLLRPLGYEITAPAGGPRCCGSAGAWSLLHPRWARRLRGETIAALSSGEPDGMVTANIGCWMHLRRAASAPVRHWIEAVAEVV